MEKKKIRVSTLISTILFSLVLLLFVLTCILQLSLPEANGFVSWSKENVVDLSLVPDMLKANYKVFIHCLILIALVLALSKLARMIFRNIMQRSNRAKTVITLLDGLIKYGSAIALFFLVLSAFGVNTRAIWESVGVITLIIGLGAQSLIADIIAGVFIIFENEYNVGEIVSIDGFRGTVSEIGIRATKITDAAGNIKIINNSDIKNVVNLSRELSLAVVDCEVSYDVPLELVEKVLKDNLPAMKEKIPQIIEGPFYKGVSEYKASNAVLKILATCKEEDRFQVQRDILREYHQIFLQNGIDFDYERFVIEKKEKKQYHVPEETKEQAESFIEEQKAASSGMEEQHKD